MTDTNGGSGAASKTAKYLLDNQLSRSVVHPRLDRWDAALLAVVGLSLLVPALGRIPFRRAEIYFADAARAMVESGDWLVPYFRGAPFFDKPVLTYWLMAGSFTSFGFSTVSARIPSVVATLAVLLVTLWLGRMLWSDNQTGLAAGLVLAATPSFIDFGRLAMSDALLTLWSTLAVALVVFIFRAERTIVPTIALGVTLGLGFLTKGPIAWITPCIGAACVVWFHRERRPRLSPVALTVAALVALSIAFGWFVAVFMRLGWDPLDHFFLKENVARFSGDSYNVGNPIWFFPQTYLHEGAPWSIFFPFAAVYFLWRERDRECRWLLVWILLDTILLSFSRGKLGYYLLPLYPAVSLVIARYFTRVVWGRVAKGLSATFLLLTASILVAVAVAVTRAPSGWRPGGWTLAAVVAALVATALACAVAAIRPRPFRMLAVMTAVSIVIFTIAEGVMLPAFYEGQPNHSIVEYARRERLRRDGLRIAARQDFAGISRDLLFETRLPLDEGADLPALAASAEPYLLIAEPREASTLEAMPHMRKIAEYRYMSSRIFSVRGVMTGVEPTPLFLFANFVE